MSCSKKNFHNFFFSKTSNFLKFSIKCPFIYNIISFIIRLHIFEMKNFLYYYCMYRKISNFQFFWNNSKFYRKLYKFYSFYILNSTNFDQQTWNSTYIIVINKTQSILQLDFENLYNFLHIWLITYSNKLSWKCTVDIYQMFHLYFS